MDFSTETEVSKVTSAWISPELFDKLPNPPKSKRPSGEAVTKISRAHVMLFNQAVELSFDPTGVENPIEQYIGQMNELLNWLVENKGDIDSALVRDLLELKNSTWLDENQTPLKQEAILKALRLTSINFFADGSCELNYDDGSLFGGHFIAISVSAKREVGYAILQG